MLQWCCKNDKHTETSELDSSEFCNPWKCFHKQSSHIPVSVFSFISRYPCRDRGIIIDTENPLNVLYEDLALYVKEGVIIDLY